MQIDKFAMIKKQEWYDRDWSMTPKLWELLKEVYFTDKTIAEAEKMRSKIDCLQSLTKLDVTLLNDNLINLFYDYVNDPFPQTKEDVIYIMNETINLKNDSYDDRTCI